MGLADYIKTELPKWPNWINNILLKMNFLSNRVYGPKYDEKAKEIEQMMPETELVNMVNFAIENVPYYRKNMAASYFSLVCLYLYSKITTP